VLIRAHAALLAGDVPGDLRPWLYRLTRNRAIDEVRRARWGDEALESDVVASDDREDPDVVLRRKETLRRLVDDLADLPVRQRTALLARELDDQSAEGVAEQLGVSVAAAQMLATRARENLLKARDARDADHADVRAALLDARERGVRPSEHVLRHVRDCEDCRAFQREIRHLSSSCAR
jgi:RNA polymerase sigma factor (sigma-70 family)